jgi:hypothetical protein
MASQRPADDEIVRQIADLWGDAKDRLGDLREAVERTAEFGKAQAGLLRRRSERETAVLRLGEATYKLIQAGELSPPTSLKRAVGEVKAKDEELQRTQSDISAILKEADALVEKGKKGQENQKKKPARKG